MIANATETTFETCFKLLIDALLVKNSAMCSGGARHIEEFE